MSKGGGSSTPANTTNQTTTTVQLPDWAQSYAQQNAAQAQALSQQPYTAYTGPEVAGMSQDQTNAIAAVNALQGQAGNVYGGAISNVQNLPQATQSLLNPYLGSVEADTVSNINRAAALQGQQDEAQAVGQGAFGGTRDAVQQALLQSETQRNIGQAINQIQSQGWNTASNQALTQAQLEGQLATGQQTAGLQAAGAQYTMGAQEQALQQAQYSNALQNWQAQQNWPYQQLAIAQSALAGTPYGNTTTSQQPYSSNNAASILGGVASMLPAGYDIGKWAGLWGSGSGAAGSTAAGKGAADTSAAFDTGTAAAAGAGTAAATGAAADTAGKGAADVLAAAA